MEENGRCDHAELIARLIHAGLVSPSKHALTLATEIAQVDPERVRDVVAWLGETDPGVPASVGAHAEAVTAIVVARSQLAESDLFKVGHPSRTVGYWRVIAYAAVRWYDERCSYPEIGRWFGRDHTTIMSGVRRVAGRPSMARIAREIADEARAVVQGAAS